MKKFLLSLSLASLVLAVAHADGTKDSVLYVCGGNTGRSVMAEWYSRSAYPNINTFSRGSGIDPNDQVATEKFARALIVENHDATPREIDLQRATSATITDIYNSTVVLSMGTKHSKRLKNLIDRECANFNLNYTNRNFNKQQWWAMCQHKDQLKAKIHSLISCASGSDGEIADALGQNKAFYLQIREQIKANIQLVMANHQTTGNWCVATEL